MKIFISSDHAGFELKGHIMAHLQGHNIEVMDLGPHTFDATDDYPDLIPLVAQEISANRPEEFGIILGYSGQGEALVANKFKNVRAGVYYGGPVELVKLMREHNNANIMSLGAHFLTKEEAESAVDIFINTYFSGHERHVRRINKISQLEANIT
ncbi:RpiB/LacA/LacB family sugar-phosphate isomerase [Candidatus Parcubacteria bacterium]|nr:RpiB/LacA/LacB family sugar-phosphate isomerase [Candidatus Parcubacteria bacterium]